MPAAASLQKSKINPAEVNLNECHVQVRQRAYPILEASAVKVRPSPHSQNRLGEQRTRPSTRLAHAVPDRQLTRQDDVAAELATDLQPATSLGPSWPISIKMLGLNEGRLSHFGLSEAARRKRPTLPQSGNPRFPTERFGRPARQSLGIFLDLEGSRVDISRSALTPAIALVAASPHDLHRHILSRRRPDVARECDAEGARGAVPDLPRDVGDARLSTA